LIRRLKWEREKKFGLLKGRFFDVKSKKKKDKQIISVAKCIVKWVHYIKLGTVRDIRGKLTKSQA
jgi:hypothetical protein